MGKLAVICAFGLIAVLFVKMFTAPPGLTQPIAIDQKARPTYSPDVVEHAVREILRDPDSAVFDNMHPHIDGVCGEVNAKNGFGGYTGKTAFVYVNVMHEAVIDPRIHNASFVKLWNRVCTDWHPKHPKK